MKKKTDNETFFFIICKRKTDFLFKKEKSSIPVMLTKKKYIYNFNLQIKTTL